MVLSTSTPIASSGAGRTFKPRTPRGSGFSGSRFGIERDERKPVEAGKLVVVSADINYEPVPASVSDGNNNHVLNVPNDDDSDVLAGTATDCYPALDGQWPSMMQMVGTGTAGGDDDGSENRDTKRVALRYADASRKQPEAVTGASVIGGLPCPSSSGVIIGKPVNLMLSKMSLLWNTSGWLRVYCGPDRSEISSEDRSRMIHVVTTATTLDVVKDMNLPGDYTLWVQTGGGRTRRLEENEYPLLVQEEFLRSLGYFDESRRARLGIDPELKHLIRFHIGPAEIPMCKGVLRSGTVEVLKGLVFPQWRRRHLAIVGSKLILYPGSASFPPEVYELAGANVFEHAPCDNRLVIKIVPKASGSSSSNSNSTSSSVRDSLDRGSSLASVDFIDSAGTLATVYPGSSARHALANGGPDSESTGETAVLFLGFRESWERDQWSIWLSVDGRDRSTNQRLDLDDSGLQQIPDIFLQAPNAVEELLAGRNKLQEIALRALGQFTYLKVLRLNGNALKDFPDSLYHLRNLRLLDLSENEIRKLPDSMSALKSLEEFSIERNELRELPDSLKGLTSLRILNAAYNQLEQLPSFMVNNMRSMSLFQRNDSLRNGHHQTQAQLRDAIQKGEDRPDQPLTKVNLRGNQLKGSIILGNYGLLTQLDVSENSIEVMDLSALDKLETIQCCRNSLRELTLSGRSLHSLIAGNNNLTKITVRATPTHLKHMDLSYNCLQELPDWLVGCHQLRTLYANNNQIHTISEHLLNNEHATIQTLHLAYNQLTSFPPMVKRKLPLQKLYLQCNLIEDLPENFFIACERLTILNVSSNKLMTLPIIFGSNCSLERLYATNNSLTDRVLDSLICLPRLRVLHLGYNLLTTMPETCISCWGDLEELVISGNKLRHLPENLANMASLRVLRVHSNQLQTVPSLGRTITLRVLDLAHNQLDKVNIASLVPRNLQFLDLSGNKQLQVDAQQLKACRNQRPMALVDVSGKNRPSLPTTPLPYQEQEDYEPCWKVGFAETSGCLPKLSIAQLRLPGFCNSEGLFGLFDGETSNAIPNLLVKTIPKILLEERTVKETANDYMKYTLLSAHRELKQRGQQEAVNVTLCHIARSRVPTEAMSYLPQAVAAGRKFILRVATVGECSAVLIKHNRCVMLNKGSAQRKLGLSANFPVTVPDPEVQEVVLSDADEYLVLGNRKLWEVITMDTVAEEIRKEDNILLAAKRVQDIAQSYGAEENLSVMIVRFNNLGTDVDFLMRELRQTIRKNPRTAAAGPGGSLITGFCKCGCCCETNNSCCHSAAAVQFVRHPSGRSDRSSPSGQSDQTSGSETVLLQPGGALQAALRAKSDSSGGSVGSLVSRRPNNAHLANERRSLRGGVVRAVRAKIEEEKEKEIEESDSAMSEEQFKCWEYMLEQNTQLLFDKELNTISRGFTTTKRQAPLPPLAGTGASDSGTSNSSTSTSTSVASNLTKLQLKNLSTSSPQLAQLESDSGLTSSMASGYSAMMTTARATPFLSKQFGSTRSFHPASSQSYFKPIQYNGTSANPARRPINTGPNAAYFGSLQRLMPYNLEYDLATAAGLPPERYPGGSNGNIVEVESSTLELDTIDPDGGRMRQYWGVATTEL
ncbi:protein phosphatase PHLPP-like protein [Anopheles albimanus]|uniref:protein phosphatase PHLPP-like protein n=1 Tax=Anopheles albimanus TaxID=7167 RepID=UPI001640A878|nr:protein phosphatase PHLPP-like protein [Anopheles albimanus]